MKTKTTKEIKAELQQNEIIRLENRYKFATTEQELDQIEKQIFKIKKQRGDYSNSLYVNLLFELMYPKKKRKKV